VFPHIPVAGSQLTKDYRSTSNYEITVEEIQPECFIGVLMGHYHTAQLLADNMLYLGSLLQESFCDIDQQKGFWEMDLCPDRQRFIKSLKFIHTNYPQFRQIEIKDKAELLKFLTSYDPKSFYKLEKNSNIIIPHMDFSNVTVISKAADVGYKARIEDMDVMTPAEVVAAYAIYKHENSSVLEYGLSILERLKQEKSNESREKDK
jgi:DNA repair exonuclease SbcCD nuclease subunit